MTFLLSTFQVWASIVYVLYVLFLDLPNLTTFIIDPSENIHLSLLRFVNVKNLGPIQRVPGEVMPNLDFPALVNFLYTKDGISNAMNNQAHAERQIHNQRPDREFYTDFVYEGHVCHQIQVFDRSSLQQASDYFIQSTSNGISIGLNN